MMHSKEIISAGKPLKDADKALIMLHGRGSNAQDILGLARHLDVEGFALLAPQATNNTWYPYSFMANSEQNEPWLTSALEVLKETLDEVVEAGIPAANCYFLGFSQGACLTLEFVARNARRYGGVIAFTGGLIGDKVNCENYSGDFEDTRIFIGSGNPDPHVPLGRVKESARMLEEMDGSVTLKIYENRPHTVSPDEIEIANALILKK
ncbi:alpha/beta hydrolase [Anseongella ginsenosidimutans]|nr:phospholipase [Anseongella ginsenosidimutans]